MQIVTVKKIYFILIAIFLFFIGNCCYDDLLNNIISNNSVQISSTKLSSQFFEPIYFGLSLAIIPILIMLSWKFVTNKIMSLILIIGFSLFGFLIELRNIFFLLSSQLNENEQILVLEKISFSIYIFFGSLIGFFLLILIFKKSKPQS